MQREIIKEFNKSDENAIIPGEHELTWAKRVDVLRAQAAVINSIHELKNFDAMLKMDKGKHREKISHTCENTCKRKMKILWHHSP